MTINALLMDPKDNVVTCVRDVKAGMTVYYREEREVKTISAKEDIPYCHKILLRDVEEGAEIIKYGECIGRTLCAVKKGFLVSDKNIASIPRDYEAELILSDKETEK